ncbi:MAG: protein kinase [Proteobacteria bacterium]|nr:protein kinase [Pseudomonadota bacterium]
MDSLDALRAGRLAGARHLKLACGLTEFPPEILELADTLEVLDLSGNRLASLPPELSRLHRLRILFCSGNPFTVLPEVLGECPRLEMVGFKSCDLHTVPMAALPARLRWLILTDNAIADLPAAIGHCAGLQKLMLAGNRLRALPDAMAACTGLELLRISANRLTALPAWLFELPRLSWLAYAGNPFCASVERSRLGGDAAIRIPRADLSLGERLGEGASGVIRLAAWAGSGGERPVAVKLFKGTMTSDGLPQHEMRACLEAGDHPGLIPVLGRLEAEDEAADGLVMALIDQAFANLAGPPSLESCTRDVYADGATFTMDAVLRIAGGITSVAAHLHRRGILHGDLYAHNILHTGEGRALLGDFGAASFFAPDDEGLAPALQRIEVRAFACLLEELIVRCAESGPRLQSLERLQRLCADPVPSRRPLFEDVEAELARIAALALHFS